MGDPVPICAAIRCHVSFFFRLIARIFSVISARVIVFSKEETGEGEFARPWLSWDCFTFLPCMSVLRYQRACLYRRSDTHREWACSRRNFPEFRAFLPRSVPGRKVRCRRCAVSCRGEASSATGGPREQAADTRRPRHLLQFDTPKARERGWA